jgi:hypothetical protein
MRPFVALSTAIILHAFLAAPLGAAEEGIVYNRFNIHYYSKGAAPKKVTYGASYANYIQSPTHALLPYNTKLRVGKASRGGFLLTVVDGGMQITFEYDATRMAMTQQAYLDLITSPEPVDYPNLSAPDKDGVKQGVALVGMTKEGVKIALGYPATHKTPSLDANAWVYWKNRFTTTVVNFDAQGLVSSVGP